MTRNWGWAIGADEVTHAAGPAEDAAGAAGGPVRREAVDRQEHQPRPPGAYRSVERAGHGGGTVVRYRTHKGQLCRPDTTPAEAVAMWEAKQRRLRSVLTIGPNRAARLGALLSPADRAEYERLLREQRCGVRWLVAWLAERGHPVSPGTVRAHREQFLLSLLGAHESTRLAAAFADAARDRGDGGRAGLVAVG